MYHFPKGRITDIYSGAFASIRGWRFTCVDLRLVFSAPGVDGVSNVRAANTTDRNVDVIGRHFVKRVRPKAEQTVTNLEEVR